MSRQEKKDSEQKKDHQRNLAYTFKTEVMTSKNGSI